MLSHFPTLEHPKPATEDQLRATEEALRGEIDRVELRLRTHIDERFQNVDERFQNVDERLYSIAQQIAHQTAWVCGTVFGLIALIFTVSRFFH